MNLLMQMRQIKDLSPSERHIVEYIFENLYNIENIGIVELAEKTYTSTATIKRLCKKLGIESYIDFRLQLSRELASYTELTILKTAQNPVGHYDSVEDIFTKVSSQNAKSIIDTRGINDITVVKKIIHAMSKASRIDFYGTGPSNIVAEDAQQKCMRLGIQSSAYGNRNLMLINSKAYIEGTLAFLISYTGTTDVIIEIANELMINKVPSVSITSVGHNPLSGLCLYNLFVDASESWNRLGGMSSRISTLNMIDILFTALIYTDFEKYSAIISKTFIDSSIM
jgi:RpiR family transcriptional regulator, murPQ operon repressor